MIEFKLGDKVKTTSGGRYNSFAGKGTVIGIFLDTYNQDKLFIQVRLGSNQIYNYEPNQVTLLKTQTLYAYTDSTSEVHWATKQYTTKELTSFGLTPNSKFNKTIDLE